MTATSVTPLHGRSNAGSNGSAPKKIQYEDRIAAAVGRRLGIRTSTAAHLMAEIGPQMVVILEELTKAGALARKERLMTPIRAADAGTEAPPLCPATLNLAAEADAKEDVARTRFLQEQSDRHLDQEIGALEQQQRYGDAALMALYCERDRRRRMP